MEDCKSELHKLLLEDVSLKLLFAIVLRWHHTQRLAGASLLVFANKQDIPGSMNELEIQDVCSCFQSITVWYMLNLPFISKVLDLPSIKSHNWRIWPCSAMTGDNLIKGLDWVVEDVARRLYYSSTLVQGSNAAKAPATWILRLVPLRNRDVYVWYRAVYTCSITRLFSRL